MSDEDRQIDQEGAAEVREVIEREARRPRPPRIPDKGGLSTAEGRQREQEQLARDRAARRSV